MRAPLRAGQIARAENARRSTHHMIDRTMELTLDAASQEH
jgi:hypothetical protein